MLESVPAVLDRGLCQMTHELRGALKTAARGGLLEQLPPLAWPQAAALAKRQGLGAHMVHALWALAAPDRVALVDDQGSLTYAQAEARINQLAHALRQLLRPGEARPVALMLENSASYLLCWTALLRLGVGCIHSSPRASAQELAYILEHSGAQLVVTSQALEDVARLAATGQGAQGASVRVALLDPGLSDSPTARALWTLAERQPTSFPERMTRQGRNPSSSDNIVYTSGTTGKPKGAVRDLKSVGLKELLRLLERLPVQAAERHLIVCPLYHSGAQVFALMMAALGATIFIRPRFEAQDTLASLSRHAIHSVFVGPTMIHRLVQLPEQVWAKHPTPALRALISGAAPFPQALRERAMTRFGARVVFDFYGATELGWVTVIDGEQMRLRPGSVGRPLRGQRVVILDERGQALPAGQIGVIHVRNEQLMRGYLRHDEAPQADASNLGALTVEDLGYLDEAGYLYISGRARDMVISGGVNLYPVEIEEVLAKHPQAQEVAVVGEPDEEWGERLVAFVVTDDPCALTPQTLERWARASLSGPKIPRRWIITDEPLPRNPTGKVLKRLLRERLGPAALANAP